MKNHLRWCMVVGFIFFQFILAFADTVKTETAEDFKKRGDLFLSQNNNAEAVDAYEKALELNPDIKFAQFSLGRAYARLKNYDKAVEHMELSLKNDPSISSLILPNLVLIYLFKNDIKAAGHLKKIVEIDSQGGQTLLRMVFYARMYGIKEVDGGLKVEHNYLGGSTDRVVKVAENVDMFINSGEYYKAIARYQEFLAKENLAPKEKALVLYTIGTLYLTNLNKSQEGLPFLQQAVEIDSTEPDYRMTLVDAYRSLEQYDKALDEIHKILSLDPNSKYGLYFGGAVYFKKEDWKHAVESWNKLKKVDELLFSLIEEEYDKAKALNKSSV